MLRGHAKIDERCHRPAPLPFTIKLRQRLPDTDLLESFGPENENDTSHLEGKEAPMAPRCSQGLTLWF
jgi:hypothetical protein